MFSPWRVWHWRLVSILIFCWIKSTWASQMAWRFLLTVLIEMCGQNNLLSTLNKNIPSLPFTMSRPVCSIYNTPDIFPLAWLPCLYKMLEVAGIIIHKSCIKSIWINKSLPHNYLWTCSWYLSRGRKSIEMRFLVLRDVTSSRSRKWYFGDNSSRRWRHLEHVICFCRIFFCMYPHLKSSCK